MNSVFRTLAAFLGACALIAASPGPSTMLIIRQSLRGRRAGFLTVLGNETGVFIWGVVAACGLTALLAASELAYTALRIVGAVVLIGFGVQTLRAVRAARIRPAGPEDARPDDARPEHTEREPAEAKDTAGAAAAGSAARAYRGGLLLNLANPKAAVFAMSFLPQFVPAGAPELPSMIVLAAIWALYEVGHYGLYVWFVGRMRGFVSRAAVRRRLELASGGVLVALGVRMAAEG
jgi:threonine/homoserine/homoserine lactone efflux protein